MVASIADRSPGLPTAEIAARGRAGWRSLQEGLLCGENNRGNGAHGNGDKPQMCPLHEPQLVYQQVNRSMGLNQPLNLLLSYHLGDLWIALLRLAVIVGIVLMRIQPVYLLLRVPMDWRPLLTLCLPQKTYSSLIRPFLWKVSKTGNEYLQSCIHCINILREAETKVNRTGSYWVGENPWCDTLNENKEGTLSKICCLLVEEPVFPDLKSK